MENREDVLLQAYLKNSEETQKWLRYKTDHEESIKNLENFRNKMSVEVMVPIGSKALMPGQLVHTNEVLISHFGKTFSNCTTYQAVDICKNRIRIADDYLNKLEIEKQLFTNKLELPHTHSAMPEPDKIEILEEYDENKEKLWREEHRKKVRAEKQKQKPKISDDQNEKTHDEIIKRLEELEMLEELDAELEELHNTDNEKFEQLMTAAITENDNEYKLDHLPNFNANNTELNDNKILSSDIPNISDNNTKSDINVNISEAKLEDNDNLKITDHNREHDLPTNDLMESDVTSEFIKIKEQAEKIIPIEKRINFIKKKIKSTFKFFSMKARTAEQIDLKISKFETHDLLLDYLSKLEDILESPDSENLKTNNRKEKGVTQSTKHITFALKDEITYIDENDSVQDFMEKINRNKQVEKDIVVLDPEFQINNKTIDNIQSVPTNDVDMLSSIKERVEKSVEYVQENQSHQDCDLITKIINESKGKNTLQIKFKHSSSVYKDHNNKFDIDLIGSPADFYKMLSQKSGIQEFENDGKNKCINEVVEEKTYENNTEIKNLKKQEDVHLAKTKDKPAEIKRHTILKNKDAVKLEYHYKHNQSKVNTNNKEIIPKMIMGDVVENSTPQLTENQNEVNNKKLEINSKMVIGDVVENPTPQKPSDTTDIKIVETNAPKKRISRFKQTKLSIT